VIKETILDSETRLSRYAEVLVRIGLRVEPGDRLLIRSPLHAADVVRHVTRHAYSLGAVNVDVLWNDSWVERNRFVHGAAGALTEMPYSPDVLNRAAARGDSVLTITGDAPQPLEDAATERMAEFETRFKAATEAYVRSMFALDFVWTVAAVPSVEWAKTVFPDKSDTQALEALWNVVLAACRIDGDDPAAGWEAHLDHLDARKAFLNQRRYTAISYEGEGTDLTVGLHPQHWWNHPGEGNGERRTVANIPTEEVSTTPDARLAQGVVRSTKPLIHNARTINSFSLRFENGVVVEAAAEEGQDELNRILDTDWGSRRLGEVALVPQSSAVSVQGIIWHQTLFDENDASHLALGAGYPFGIKNGTSMSPEQLRDIGLNRSINHIDFVVGSDDVEITGITVEGSEEPLIRNGEWAFDV
jgi:aminopeptidase